MTKNRKILLGIGCFAAFALVVTIIILIARICQTEVINQQLAALRAGDIAKAYNYTSSDFRSATTVNDFEEFVNHYAAFKLNKSATITGRETRNGTALIKVTLYSTEGTSTPVEYLLTKEEGDWKILGIEVSPTAAAELDETNDATVDKGPVTLKTYDNKDSRYTVDYPSNWEYDRAGDGTVVFSGKRGTPAYFSTVNIQTVLSKKNGGDFSTVKEFMTDIKSQANSQSPATKFLENGAITIKEKNGTKDKGEYTIFTYKYKGKEFKQWQVVVLRNDGQVFYAWAYTSPIEQYPNDLAVAKTLLDSWVIY